MPASIRSGSINLLNTIIGAGILAMPYGLKCNGLLFGVFLVAWSALTSAFGLYLQNKVAKYTHQHHAVSYFSLCQLTYPQLLVVFDSAIAIKCFGVGVLYLVVIGDLMPKIMDSLGVPLDLVWMHRNTWISLFMLVLVAPLSFLKRLDSLRYASVVALVLVVYLICLVVGHYAADGSVPGRHVDFIGPVSWRNTLLSFPIFVFAYTCHQNMFAIINELAPSETEGLPTRQANIIIRNAIVTACAAYLVVGIVGYLTFGSDVNGNIITMYPRDLVSSLIGRMCIVVMVSLSFPLQCHPCRGSINHVVYFVTQGVSLGKFRNSLVTSGGYDTLLEGPEHAAASSGPDADSVHDESFVSTTPMEGAQDTAGHDPIIVPLSTRRFYVITAVIVVASYAVAVSVTSLAHVLAFVGSTGSTSISFILPGLFGFMLVKPLDGVALTPLERFCKYGGLALSVWGVMVMVVCLSATVFLGATH